jgi:integrase
LSRQALEVIRGIWPLSDNGDLVLPAVRSLKKPLSENAMNSALRRMGYSKEEMCPHGFRSAASTILNERGVNPDVIEAALAASGRQCGTSRLQSRHLLARAREADAAVGRHARRI